MKQEILEQAIETLVPHKNTMCLLDRVCDYGDDWVETETLITAASPFSDDKGVPSWLGVEYMAQSISVLAGIRERLKGQPVKVGFLLGTRKYTVNTPRFLLGQTLRIRVEEVLWGANGLGAFNCELHTERCVAQANLNVFQPENVEEFMKEGQLK